MMQRQAPIARTLVFPAVLFSLLAITGCTKREATAYATPDYRRWKPTTDVVLDYPIPGHQDHFRIPRMNAIGFTATPTMVGKKRRWDFPVGTVIVKEVYASTKPMPEDQPIQLTIMAKEPQDPRAQGGWLWITQDLPDGKEAVFMGNFCITCHANANEKHPYGDGNPNEEFRDYVFFVPGEGK